AEVLYKLQHPQIPRFREWFVDSTRESMFLVQDYAEGPTYQEILRDREASAIQSHQGGTFSESEIITLFNQLLPVLGYIHERGVVHRDLSPDNLICRNSDRLPVLIDFGGVKEVTISAAQPHRTEQGAKNNVTLIGKTGYSPAEQMQSGQVSPASDLYALGVTALVLLTGQDPTDLYDAYHLTFDWQDKAKTSAGLTAILNKMTAHRVSERYTSTKQILQDLDLLSRNPSPLLDWTAASPPDWTVAAANHPSAQTVGSAKTVAVAPSGTAMATAIAQPATSAAPIARTPLAQSPGIVSWVWNHTVGLVRSLLVFALLIGAGVLGWFAVRWWLESQQVPSLPSGNPPSVRPTQSAYSDTERQRKAQLIDRLDQSGVSSSFFYRLANEAYFLQYPNQRGKQLGSGPEDAQNRENWDRVGGQVLDLMEPLSPESRGRLGSYSSRDRNQWKRKLRAAQKDEKQLYETTEARLLNALPMYRDTPLSNTVAFQLLNGMIDDSVKKIES
ncbi:MAG: protein kinase, partial [Thermosynechococcaceae cyanobacterium]